MTIARLSPIDLTQVRRPDVPSRTRRLIATLEAAAVRVRAGHDADAIHDLRVTCRRLSSALSLWAPVLDPSPGRLARRGLRRLRRRLSSAREREVLVEQFGELLDGEPLAVREAGLAELERLERRAAAKRARAARIVRRRRIGRLVLCLDACMATFPPDSTALLAQATERTGARRAVALDALARAAEGDDVALHQARIAVKQWRYQLEALSHGIETSTRDELSSLRSLQQCLGTIHDAAVLRDFISRRALRARAKGRDGRREALVWLREKAAQARSRALERLPAVCASVLPRF